MNSGWQFRAELLENGAKAKKSYYRVEDREEYEISINNFFYRTRSEMNKNYINMYNIQFQVRTIH